MLSTGSKVQWGKPHRLKVLGELWENYLCSWGVLLHGSAPGQRTVVHSVATKDRLGLVRAGSWVATSQCSGGSYSQL